MFCIDVVYRTLSALLLSSVVPLDVYSQMMFTPLMLRCISDCCWMVGPEEQLVAAGYVCNNC